MSDHAHTDDTSSPEQDFAIAQAVLANGELGHALYHLGLAIAGDGPLPEYQAMFDRILAESGDPFMLIRTEGRLHYSQAACLACIRVRYGELDQGLDMMASVLQMVPTSPYLPWIAAWFADGGKATAAGAEALLKFFAAFSPYTRGLDMNVSATKSLIRSMYPGLRAIAKKHPRDGRLLGLMSVVFREGGTLDEAIAMASAGYKSSPEWLTAVLLANAYRRNYDIDLALKAYQDGLRHDPSNDHIRLDIGDMLCEAGRLDEGLGYYGEVLRGTPDHPWARPSVLYFQACNSRKEEDARAVEDYARANPDNERAAFLAREIRTVINPEWYLTVLPEQQEATIGMLRLGVQKDSPITSIGLSSLESPSARLCLELHNLEVSGDRVIGYGVANIQTPDPRLPHGQVGFVLWRYVDSNASPAVDPPSEQAARIVAALAATPFDLNAWSEKGGQAAAYLGATALRDLLGVMVCPPPRPPTIEIWNWLYRVQVAAALAIGHLDAGWEGSARKSALFSLARGPLDWSVAAAIIALMDVARREPAHAAGIFELYMELFRSMPRPGGVCYEHALVHCALLLPGLPDDMVARLNEWKAEI